LEEQLSPRSRVQGLSNHRGLAPGYTTTLTNYPREDQNQQYLILSVHYHFEENAEVSEGGAGKGSIQRLTLQAQPTSIVYRPQRLTPKPRTQGPQTAVVVGPKGEEIWVDKFGRVKVQFHWDRIGAMDENSSCWVRVSSTWAGSNFGGIFIPRIGMEVIIDHLNGDPDYPILTGVVYNAANMPPWDLPANATQSGWKTKSSKGGAPGAGIKNGAGDTNVIRFEDKAGNEQLWFHAQKDQLTEVENDEDKWVGHDRRKNVDHDETNVIGNDRTETVMHNEDITVHNNRTERVDVNERISIGVNRDEDVGVSETVSIGVNRTKTIGVTETDSIGTKWGISVGKIKTESIGLFSMLNVGIANMENVGVARMTTIGVAYNLNVGMIMATTVGMNQSTTIGTKKSTTVGTQYTLNVGGGGGSGSGGGATPGINGGSSGFVADSGGGGGDKLAARVKVVVTSFMQPTAEYLGRPNAS
jgi:type VI secretion system secreted protein VgrG